MMSDARVQEAVPVPEQTTGNTKAKRDDEQFTSPTNPVERGKGSFPGLRQALTALGPVHACAALLLSANSYAWGPLGHELAGKISAEYLTRDTRERIADILDVDELTADDLAQASTWADRMRSDPSSFWQRDAGPLHYVDIPPGTPVQRRRISRRGDALVALSDFREQLISEDTSQTQRALALRFAIHIVQDLHQPLHVGNGQDRGGNQVKVEVYGKNSNLHRLWDSQVLYSAGRSERQWLSYLRRQGLLRPPVTQDADPLVWIEESIALRDRLYPAPKRVKADYMRRHLPYAEVRIAQAGIRTAAWLNATLDSRARNSRALDHRGAESGSDESTPLSPSKESWWRRLLKRFE
ncbi:MAG: hypothetical protein Cons2KO_17330 [Congregibacter sp.]